MGVAGAGVVAVVDVLSLSLLECRGGGGGGGGGGAGGGGGVGGGSSGIIVCVAVIVVIVIAVTAVVCKLRGTGGFCGSPSGGIGQQCLEQRVTAARVPTTVPHPETRNWLDI